MPGLSGRETAEAVRDLAPAAKVLYMSGYTDDLVIRGGTSEPGSTFIQKPFGSSDLARRVRDVLDPCRPRRAGHPRIVRTMIAICEHDADDRPRDDAEPAE